MQNTPVHALTNAEFNAKRAYDLVKRQVACGPRMANTDAHLECKDMLLRELQTLDAVCSTQNFSKELYGRRWDFSNIIAQIHPECNPRIALCAHWDSRPFSDEDRNFENYSKAIPGANDGASGVAVVIELARSLQASAPNLGVDLYLFDAEDLGTKSDINSWCYGSRYFCENFPFRVKPSLALVFDMVADHDAAFRVDASAYASCQKEHDLLWSTAQTRFPSHFHKEITSPSLDDHMPLIASDIPSILICDQELMNHQSALERKHYWHTQADDMRNISEKTLHAVGQTCLESLLEHYK